VKVNYESLAGFLFPLYKYCEIDVLMEIYLSIGVPKIIKIDTRFDKVIKKILVQFLPHVWKCPEDSNEVDGLNC